MMKIHFKKTFFVVIVLFLSTVFVFTIAKTAKAKQDKPTITKTKRTLALCDKRDIKVDYLPAGAKLMLKSKNPAIVKVISKKTIQALKTGETRIIVKYKKAGKVYRVGSVRIIVKRAYITDEFAQLLKKVKVELPTNNGYFSKNPTSVDEYRSVFYPYGYYGVEDTVKCRSGKAKYTYESTDKAKLKITKKGIITRSNGSGDVTVNYNETYKGKTRRICSFIVKLAKPAWRGDAKTSVSVGQVFDINTKVAPIQEYKAVVTDDMNETVNVSSVSGNGPFFENEYCETVNERGNLWNGRIRFKQKGKQYLHLYAFDYETNKYEAKSFADVEFTIDDISSLFGIKVLKKLEDAKKMNNRLFKDFSEIDSIDALIIDGHGNADDTFCYAFQDEYNYNGGYKITSSDPSVATATEIWNEEHEGLYEENSGYFGKFLVKPHKNGSCIITIEGNGAKTSFDVTVQCTGMNKYYNYFYYSCEGILDNEMVAKNKFRYEILGDDSLALNSSFDVDTYGRYEAAYPHNRLTEYDVTLTVRWKPTSKDGACVLVVYYDDDELGRYEVNVDGPDFELDEINPEIVSSSNAEGLIIKDSYSYLDTYSFWDEDVNYYVYTVDADKEKASFRYFCRFDVSSKAYSKTDIQKKIEEYKTDIPEDGHCLIEFPHFDCVSYEKNEPEKYVFYILADDKENYVGYAIVRLNRDNE